MGDAMSDPVVRWQVVTSDPDSVSRFYSDTFGWTITTANALGYREADTGPGGISGGFWPAPPGVPGFAQLFIAVDDVERSVTDAVARGAKIIVPVSVLPDGDTMAILSDPAGMSFGVMKKR
jgi:predicted enzyme related to lactoylglutathione lyase